MGRQQQPGGRPYSGLTTVVDFSAHAHRDTTNMVGGCTAIVTLTKPENRGGPGEADDEQFHTLPMYVPEEAELAADAGGLQVLRSFKKRVVLQGPREPSASGKKHAPKRKAAGPPMSSDVTSPPKQSYKVCEDPSLVDAAPLPKDQPPSVLANGGGEDNKEENEFQMYESNCEEAFR